MAGFDLKNYGNAVELIFDGERLSALGPGNPDHAKYNDLKVLTVEQVFEGKTVRDKDFARCCLSGLWLYYDFLDESHTISQGIHTPSGSYWHGIMHRREPDYSNAGYWFRKVGSHPVFDTLCGDASRIVQDHGTPESLKRLAGQSRWDAFAFIDLCEEHNADGSETETVLRKIQQREWWILFDYCYQQAV